MSTSLCSNTINIVITAGNSLIFSCYAFHTFHTTHSSDTNILNLNDTGSQSLRFKNLLYSITLSQVDTPNCKHLIQFLSVCNGCGLTLDVSHTMNDCLANYLNTLQPTGAWAMTLMPWSRIPPPWATPGPGLGFADTSTTYLHIGSPHYISWECDDRRCSTYKRRLSAKDKRSYLTIILIIVCGRYVP